jgi:hypothetical protein
MKKHIRVLFICKKRPACYGVSYGLINSCKFLCNALHDMGVEAKVVEVVDNNCIDHEVTKYDPTHVFIEALWVVPEKFNELIPLHPDVHWYIRLHSNVPFIAQEGMAMDWIKKYFALEKTYSQFRVSSNANKMVNDLNRTFGVNTVYAPNIYQPVDNGVYSLSKSKPPKPDPNPDHGNDDDHGHDNPPEPPIPPEPPAKKTLEVGCFGAIRSLKDQLIQAMAAIVFVEKLKRTLNFHINYTRVETQGDSIYRNLQALFEGSGHNLVIHSWLNHEEFLALVSTMDLGMQVSFSETFNIIAADFVYVDIPVVGSHETEWMSALFMANTTDLNSIVDHLESAWLGRKIDLQALNRVGLIEWNERARKVWKKLLQHR